MCGRFSIISSRQPYLKYIKDESKFFLFVFFPRLKLLPRDTAGALTNIESFSAEIMWLMRCLCLLFETKLSIG